MKGTTGKDALTYDELVAKTGYSKDQIYAELSSLLREYAIDLNDVNEAVSEVEREKICIGEVVYSDSEVTVEHTGTIDFDADSWVYMGTEPLIRDALKRVMTRWEAKEPLYDRHPLTAYDRGRYTAMLNKRRREMFSNYRVFFAVAFKQRGEECDPTAKLTETVNRILSSGSSSRSAVFLSAYIRGHGGIDSIDDGMLAEGVAKHEGHDPSEVLNGIPRREDESLRHAVHRRYRDSPLYPNQTPYVLQFREIGNEIELPQPAVSVFEERNVYGDDQPDRHIELQTVYTAEGFVPPIDRRLADEYRRSVGQGADPQADVDELFRGSPTTHVGRPSQLAGRFDRDIVTSQWTLQDRPPAYQIVVANREPVDYPDVEVPVYIPDVEPAILAKYLKPIATDSYHNAATPGEDGQQIKRAVDEMVDLYGIERSVAEFCIEEVENEDSDGFYYR